MLATAIEHLVRLISCASLSAFRAFEGKYQFSFERAKLPAFEKATSVPGCLSIF